MKRIFFLSSAWFFTETGLFWKLLLIYVRGDMLVLIPFLFIAIVIGLFSLRWMVIVLALYAVCRFLGEMVYWLLQQFGDRKYRPYDWGFRRLDNNAIYILYQTWSLVGLVLSLLVTLFALTSWN